MMSWKYIQLLSIISVCIGVNYASMQWTLVQDTNAVCNDYSRAGFFIERTDTTKWIIFLESGGLCYSSETCNERFFKADVRTEFSNDNKDFLYNFDPDFNLNQTWATLISLNRSLSERINPYMTSITTYINDNQEFARIDGKDFLDSSKQLNPLFHDFNRVVIPYCSSDMWLAEDNYVPDGVDLNSANPQKQFLDNVYSPEAKTLQFTFRGQTILKGVIKQLLENNSLSDATEILLAGSSAGGLGVVNNAKWIMSELENNTVDTNISILVDSSWFINFRGNIFRRFDGTVKGGLVSDTVDRTDTRLFDLIESVPQCTTVTPTGSPCCISLECVLLDERYFPVGQIPVMVVFSLYDIFLLGDAIAQLIPPGVSINEQPSLGTEFVITIAEYGGGMNSSIIDATPQLNGFSFIATQCFQHVYFATSTLWGTDGIFGNSLSEQIDLSLGQFTGSLSHYIQSGVWNNYDLTVNEENDTDTPLMDSCNETEAHTMQDAINMWYRCRYQKSFEFRDSCYSLHCHNECPEKINFFPTQTAPYPDWAIMLIICIVVFITIMSIIAKVSFYLWKLALFKKQDQYLERVEKDEENFLDGIPQFPVCGLEDAVSIACLDLKYSVAFRKKNLKDERRDSTTLSFAIAHHIQDEEDRENQFLHSNERRSGRSYRSVRNMEDTQKVSASQLGVIIEGESELQNDVKQKKTNVSDTTGDLNSKKTQARSSPGTSSRNVDFRRQNAYDKKDSNSSIPYSTMSPDRSSELEHDMMNIEEAEEISCNPCKAERKQILKGVSIYFNPGELVGIMGPSGCGKTTFLDLLTGRRRPGHVEGEIFVNGVPMDYVRDEYLSSTGYVLQSATPYYEELTVRENITLSAQMKLPRKMTWREKFERVEQVIDVTGLTNVSDIMVGGLSGPGLSGGQKKRLTIALQLLTMPKVIFLDEPTSGLDSTASVELLSHLNNLADSNRTVVLTIHQPRLEIFHMFHKLILLSDGKIAYHGVPQKAYGFFVEAAVNSFLHKNLSIPEIGEHNPADIIMDMLGKPVFRRAILSHYQESTEPELIKWAIRRAKVKDFESMSIDTLDDIQAKTLKRQPSISTIPYRIHENDFVKQDKAAWFNRLAVLETRADKRTTLIWRIYLPIIFFGYGFLLGTVYYQQDKPLLIMAGFCVYSVASALFMFPVMQNYFIKALDVYRFENADGAGRASDIIIQAVARFSTMAIIPVVLCSVVLYLFLVKYEFWSIKVLLQLIIVGMALNQTWIALLTSLLCALPSLAFRLSPIISSVAGFSSGFFIPREETQWWYRWIFYINPNYYGFSASAHILLSDFNNDCNGGVDDILKCYVESGNYVLQTFNFDGVRPYMHVAILLMMTLLYWTLAVFSNWVRHTNFFTKLRSKLKSKKTFMDVENDSLLEEEEDDDETETEETLLTDIKSSSTLGFLSPQESDDIHDLTVSPFDDDVFESNASPTDLSNEQWLKKPSEVKNRWIRFAQDTVALEKNSKVKEEIELECSKHPVVDSQGRPRRLDFRQRQKRKRVQSIFLNNQEHMVFKPLSAKTPTTPTSQFANLVNNLVVQKKIENATPIPSPSGAGNSLKERREHFEWSIKATQEVVKEKTEELNKIDEMQREKWTLRAVTERLTERIKEERVPKLASVVGEVMKLTVSAPTSFEEDSNEEASSIVDKKQRANSTTGPSLPRHNSKTKRRQMQNSNPNLFVQKVRDIANKKPLTSSSRYRGDISPKTLRNISTSSDIDLSKNKNTDTNNLSLSVSSMDASSPGLTRGQKPPYLSSQSVPPAPVSGQHKLLEDIQEVTDETDKEAFTERGIHRERSPFHCSVPDIRITCDEDFGTVGRYRKLSDPCSPLLPDEHQFKYNNI